MRTPSPFATALLLGLPLILAACQTSAADPHAAAPAPEMRATQIGPVGARALAPLMNAQGAQIGAATLTEGPRGVLIQIEVNPGALTPGVHGLHLHMVGTCSDTAAGFMASGAHVGHGNGAGHGFLSADGPEAGDLTNLFVPESGPARAEIFTTLVTLDSTHVAARAPLLDADGSVLIVHANADDYASQPIGNAGPRVACGVISAG